MSAPRDYALTFTGAGTLPIRTTGRHIRILESPVSNVWVEVDGSRELKRTAGQGINVGASGFRRLLVRSAVAQTVLVSISDERQDDDQQSVAVTTSATIAPGNTLDAGGDVPVPALTSQTVIGADATRLAVLVHNISDQELRIGGAGVGAASGVPLAPGEEKGIATTAIVACYNPHATVAKSVAVLPVREV